jgi:VIT1/CCC1 family predicted Fe2+/Mn2+ transporter
MVPTWLPTTIILAYSALVILLALTGVFSETERRRQAARSVLLIVLPVGVVGLALEQWFGSRA